MKFTFLHSNTVFALCSFGKSKVDLRNITKVDRYIDKQRVDNQIDER